MSETRHGDIRQTPQGTSWDVEGKFDNPVIDVGEDWTEESLAVLKLG